MTLVTQIYKNLCKIYYWKHKNIENYFQKIHAMNVQFEILYSTKIRIPRKM